MPHTARRGIYFPARMPYNVRKRPGRGSARRARRAKGKGKDGMEKILKLLEENARMSVEDIAGAVGETPEAVAVSYTHLDVYKRQTLL